MPGIGVEFLPSPNDETDTLRKDARAGFRAQLHLIRVKLGNLAENWKNQALWRGG